MIVCDECGRENEDDYKFCLGCGHELSGGEESEQEEDEAVEVACPYCGTEQPASFKFCGSCGERIPDDVDEETVEGRQPEETGGTGMPGSAVAEERSVPSSADDGDVERAEEPETEGEVRAHLVVIQPDGTEGATIDVHSDELELGRSSHFDSLADDPFLSPHHATLVRRNGEYWMEDEDSVNGVFREVTGEAELGDEEEIRLGQELLVFERLEPGSEESADGVELDGSPDPGYWGRLALIAGPETETEAYALEEDEITIGRETGEIVFPDDGFVSGTHAAIVREDGGARVRDLDSSNGTFIRVHDRHHLRDGERVLMGQQLFRLEVE